MRRARRHRPRVAAILLGLLAALGLTVAAGLSACGLLDARGPESRLAGDRISGSIVTLGRGRTMVAPSGTVAADIVAWLASREEGKRRFEAGGRQFLGNSDEPAPDSWNRIERFATMLQANHDVRARIVGYSDASGDPAEDRRLSEARARRVMDEIAGLGVEPSRLSFEGRGSADPVADDATLDGRAHNRRVAIILSRSRP